MNGISKNPLIVFLCGLAIVLAYLLPYYLNGEDSLIRIHDNLDSNVVWLKVLLDGGYFTDWSKSTLPQIMNGVPISSLAPIYDISALMMGLFGMFWGYVILKSLMALTGYVGMWLLLRRFVIPKESVWIAGGVAVCYGILPFWGFGLAVAALPLFFWAFLSIRKQGRKAGLGPWLAMIFGGFISSLILVGVFFIGVCGLWTVFDAIFKKRKPWTSILALGFLSVSYVLSHIRIFIGFFDAKVISHRIEMDFTYSWVGTLFYRAEGVLVNGQYHAASLHTYFIPVILLALVLMIWKWYKPFIFLNLIEFLILSSLLYAWVNWQGAQWFVAPIMKIIPIQLGRIHFLQVVAWYSLLALALVVISKFGKLGKGFGALVLVFQIVFLFQHFEARFEKRPISYKAFYSEALFTEIRNELGHPSQYRVISVGMHPSIAQYNGFYTLDSYLPDYPLEYKHRFRELIGGELDKAPELAKYFDGWGSRAYAFSAEIGKEYIFPKGNGVVIDSLDYNWDLFIEMGGVYVFAPFEIDDPDLKLVGVFKDDASAWDVYVYGLGRP